MHSTFALAAFAAVALAAPAPQAATPGACSPSYTGRFQIAAVNITTTGKRSIEARQSSCDGPGALTLTLNNGQLIDSAGRIGSIVANRQFQFDGPPPQAGAVFTSGWSACSNGSLAAIGGNTRFYQCLSGTFYNLYDQSVGAQCNPVTLQIQACSGGGAAGAGGQVGAQPDGQPTGTGQGGKATQIGDGQVQAPTGKPPVTQIGDGQIQVPTGKPVTQIGDGQVQAPVKTAAPVTQIGDGQIQAPTKPAAPPVTQIGDGQVQAPTKTAAPPVTQIGDGQVQAPTKNATNGTAPIQFTGTGSVINFSSIVAAAALGLASVLLL